MSGGGTVGVVWQEVGISGVSELLLLGRCVFGDGVESFLLLHDVSRWMCASSFWVVVVLLVLSTVFVVVICGDVI